MRILWHNANSMQLLNPENDWSWHCPTTYPKAKKSDISYTYINTLSLPGRGSSFGVFGEIQMKQEELTRLMPN